MSTISVSQARRMIAAVVETAGTEPVILERHGEPAAVVVSHAFYQRALAALEDVADAAAIDAALAEGGPNIPWAQVRQDLGWE